MTLVLAALSLLGLGIFVLIRVAGPARLLAIVFLLAGAFSLNKTDPKRLTAIAIVLVVGYGWLAYTYLNR